MSIQDYSDEINELLRFVYIPERNCSCHINPPCGDCIENGFIREACRTLDAAINKESTAMSTNSSLTYALLLPDAITVKIVFLNGYKPDQQPSNKQYTYKALLGQQLEVDDIVIVPIRSHSVTEMQMARIVEVDEFLDVNTTRDYHWVIQKVDTTQYDELREKEKVVAKHLQLRERADARALLLKQLFDNNVQENALRIELGLPTVATDPVVHEGNGYNNSES